MTDFISDTIHLTRDWSITRGNCHAAYIAAGHDAKTADQFAFRYGRKVNTPAHPNGVALLTAMLTGDMETINALYK